MFTNKIRFLYISIVAITLHFIIKYFAKVGNVGDNVIYDLMIYLVITTIVWEGNGYIDKKLNSRLSLIPKPGKRILVQFPLGAIFTVLSVYLLAQFFNVFFYKLSGNEKSEYVLFSVLIPFIGYVILFSIEIGSRFFIQMRKSLIDVEKYKAESLEAQLHNLKNQINPHFLFNNLSVLSSLVYSNQDKAVNFIQQLSKVYRYLLDNKDFELVTLEKELDFISSYTYLLKIRFEEKLILNLTISSESKKLYLPPMTLQILVENAIKHNEISEDKNLTIDISNKENTLEIKNNIQRRKYTEPSSKTGIQNIKSRYSFFTEREILIQESADQFIVQIPLIEK